MSIFQNYELRMAGEVLCESRDEATRLAEDFFGIEAGMTYKGREETRTEGIVLELFDQKDGAQENPFYCVIVER